MLSRRTLLLKPMQAAASGYVRLHKENGYTLLQLHARGLKAGETRLFARSEGHAMRELAHAEVNVHGEVSMEAEAPEKLETLFLISMPPKPLLIGLCASQDAGSLLDAKNTALALCEKLAQKPVAKNAKTEAAQEPRKLPTPAVRPVMAAPETPRRKPLPPLPREIFLPAIDPAPYTTASAKESAEPLLPPPRPSGPPVDRLRPLQWPQGFSSLKPYFETRTPVRLFDLPDWRFVAAAQGLFVGIRVQDGRVRSVAYAYDGKAPEDPQKRYQSIMGLNGHPYQVLRMEV